MRLVGPNCLGVLNTAPGVRMNATFAPGRPPAGRIAFASQSGAYGIAALELSAQRGLGLSSFVSMGDKADLSGNDFLRFWEQDPGTDVVLLYLESLGNPRRFGQIARRLTASKPVIAVKSGRTVAGRRAASSHTGALLEASEATVDALFDHAGVIRVETLDEQLDVAELLARQPLPARQSRRDRDQRRRPGDRLRRRVRRRRPARRAAAGRHPPGPARAPAAGGRRRRTPSTCSPPRRAATSAARSRRSRPTPGSTRSSRSSSRRCRAAGSAAVLRAIRTAARRAVADGRPRRRRRHDPRRASTAPPPGEPDVPVFTTPEHAARALGHAARHAHRRRHPPPAAEPPERRRSRRRRGGDRARPGRRTRLARRRGHRAACSAPTASRWRRRASRPRRMAPDAARQRWAARWR